ncbi:MAG: hypothetical protein NC086_06950, partial [Alistipes sp.]|nr:hypothetical protein [Alistipes sp.]
MRRSGKRRRRRRLLRKIMGMALFLFMTLMVTFTAKSVLGAFLPPEAGRDGERKTTSEKGKIENGGVTEYKIAVEGVSQEGIPTGCEAVTAVAALRYKGVAVTPEEFINVFLPKENFYIRNGVTYGANPHEAFPGNPFEAGLGCFSEVIVAAIEDMKACGFGGMELLTVENVSGTELAALEDYIAA